MYASQCISTHRSAYAVTGKKQSYKQLVGIDGSIKSVVRKGEKVIDVATLGPKVGKRMTVAGGRHAGLECQVKALSVNGDNGALQHPKISHAHR